MATPRAAFTTLGCKVNQYETQKIMESFVDAGFSVVPFEDEADVYVVNTCSVTSQAEAKSRYTVRKAKRTSGLAKIVVTGCAGQMSANKGEAFEGADVLQVEPQQAHRGDATTRAIRARNDLGRASALTTRACRSRADGPS